MSNDLVVDNRLEGKSGLLLFENLVHDIWYDLFAEVQINESGWW